MAQEFKSYLAGFAQLCENYCDNAEKIAPTPDLQKLVHVYRKGLTAAFAGLRELVGTHYDAASDERRGQVDEFVRLSGILSLVEEANRVIGRNSFDENDALASAGGIFEEIKKIIRFTGLAQIAYPLAGVVPNVLDLIDQLVEKIGKAITPSAPAGGKTVERPKELPHVTLRPCQAQKLPPSTDGGTYQFHPDEVNAPGFQFKPEIEISVDDQPPQLLDEFKKYSGKSFKLHLKPHKGLPDFEVKVHWTHTHP